MNGLAELFQQLGIPGIIGAWGAAIAALVAALYAVGKAIKWIAKTFFPGLVMVARNIVAGASIWEVVRELPEFTERVDHALAIIEKKQDDQAHKISDIHHETQLNSGGALKDFAVRTENRVKRIEAHLGITEDEEAVKPTPVAH